MAGRPRKYKDNAERQQAYRRRTQTPIEGSVVEPSIAAGVTKYNEDDDSNAVTVLELPFDSVRVTQSFNHVRRLIDQAYFHGAKLLWIVQYLDDPLYELVSMDGERKAWAVIHPIRVTDVANNTALLTQFRNGSFRVEKHVREFST